MRCRRSWCGIKDLPTPPTGKIKLCSSSAHAPSFSFCPFFFCKDIPANQNCLSLSSWLHSPGQTRSFFKNRFSRCLFCFVPYLLDSLSCCIFFMVEWLLAFLWLNTFLFMHAVVSKVFFFFFCISVSSCRALNGDLLQAAPSHSLECVIRTFRACKHVSQTWWDSIKSL